MTKTLILFRHAKSSWSDPTLADYERPLNTRGRAATPVMAAWIADQVKAIDAVVCSGATRTRETLERASPNLPSMPRDINFTDDVYEAAMPILLRTVRNFGSRHEADAGRCATLLMIGHNPGLQTLAVTLCQPEAGAYDRLTEKYPTAAIAIITLNIESWADIGAGRGKLIAFETPKRIAGSI